MLEMMLDAKAEMVKRNKICEDQYLKILKIADELGVCEKLTDTDLLPNFTGTSSELRTRLLLDRFLSASWRIRKNDEL